MLAQYLFAALCALAVVSSWAQMTGSTHCDTSYCITAVYDSSAQHINYTLLVDNVKPSSGWYAVGQGEQMSNANMMVRKEREQSSFHTR